MLIKGFLYGTECGDYYVHPQVWAYVNTTGLHDVDIPKALEDHHEYYVAVAFDSWVDSTDKDSVGNQTAEFGIDDIRLSFFGDEASIVLSQTGSARNSEYYPQAPRGMRFWYGRVHIPPSVESLQVSFPVKWVDSCGMGDVCDFLSYTMYRFERSKWGSYIP